MELRWPDETCLPSYADALSRGWSPDTRRQEAAEEELAQIAADPVAFLHSLVDRDGAGPPIVLPDGSTARRLPGFRKWMWDGELCGSIGFRWEPGTTDLPDHVPGHIGYSVVPWKRGRGYATEALRLILDDVRAEGLDHVELAVDHQNVASQRVIEANGGRVVGTYPHGASHGCGDALRYRIDL